jgi:phosphatidylserine/phosphatidylglycerophosphate/cardiolipin synthase-like enzyme
MLNGLMDPAKPHHPTTNPRIFAQQWEPALGAFSCQILRSMVREHWAEKNPVSFSPANTGRKEFKWTHNGDTEASIQRSYINAIGNAEKYIYIETQYFITGGSMWGRSTVANPLALNLGNRAGTLGKAEQPFHIYLLLPMFPEGDPNSSANKAQRQFQWASIRSMAKRLSSESGKPASSLLSVFFLAKWRDLGGLPVHGTSRADNIAKNKRYMIYVHSKFMMSDDRFAIIGSANLNERSLNGGRDSEIAVAIWPSNDLEAATVTKDCTRFRMNLFREHLGPAFDEAILADLSSPAAIKHIRDAASENYRAFREGRFDASKHGHLCLWPQALIDNVPFTAADRSKAPEGDEFLPDMPSGLTGKDKTDWQWDAPGSHSQSGLSFTDNGQGFPANTAE